MGKEELRKRLNWQNMSGIKATSAETDFYTVFHTLFEGNEYELIEKPKHLKNLYASVELPQSVLSQIYIPDIDLNKTKWGVSPDFAITNTNTGKIIFGEIKRQDGWVEGKKPNAGRGNAHERMCKLFAPGLQKTYRKIGKINDPCFLPFWVVFQGDITRDPKRNREISFWFDEFPHNFFMWRPQDQSDKLVEHFITYIQPYLE